MEALIQPFIDHLRFEKRYSEHTIRSYHDDLIQFFDFLVMEFGGVDLEGINPPMIRSWFASLKDAGLSSRSINRKASSLKSFYKFNMRIGKVAQSPMAAIIGPKVSKRLPVYVEREDMQVLFGHVVFPDDWEGDTDRLLLAVFYQTGMRLSELVNLREGQVDMSKRSLKVLGKGNKERIIPVNPLLIDALRDYCAGKEEGMDREYLFVTGKGKPLYSKYVYRAVNKYLAQVTTIEKKSPHVLRHSFATHLMNEGADLNSVKELLGHASLAATQVYTHNTIEKLKEVHKRAHPKG